MIFDEKSLAETMHDTQSFIDKYCLAELRIYAKWLKYTKMEEIGKTYETLEDDEIATIEKYVELSLIDFCEQNYKAFNYVLNYKDIDLAVASTRLQRLKIAQPLPITVNEWNVIKSIKNKNLEKIAFTMLVDAKYFRYFNASLTKETVVNEETVFYVQMDNADILKTANVKFNNKEDKMFCFFELKKRGLIDITTGKYKAKYLKFVDIDQDSEILGYVTDYEHIDLHYDLFSGGKIGKCKHCGKLFKQNQTGKIEYCYKHRGYNKVNFRFGICVDCGVEFSVSSFNHKKKRCEKCQKIYRKQYKHEMYISKNKNETLE